MTTEKIFLEKIQHLPDYMYVQVLDYVDFLLAKHSEIEKSNENPEISDEHKNILIQRFEKYKNDENAGDNWENVKQRLMKKYAI